MADVYDEPTAELHPGFSSEGATPTPWAEAREHLKEADIYWVATVRPDGRPHVTPVVAVWLDDSMFFSTGRGERKARNLARNPHCIVMTGRNTLSQDLDLVLEGDAALVKDQARLQRVADTFASRYGAPFRFTVHDGAFHGEGGEAIVYEVKPTVAFGFGRGRAFSQTRWRF